MIRERNEETLNHILNEKAAIDGGIQVWEPSDSLRASVEV